MRKGGQEITEVDNVLLSGEHLTDEEMEHHVISDTRAIEAYANFIKSVEQHDGKVETA
ncbi:hypothetical protein [Pediococcus stilesii]|uniref:hypothetical protein n=1 Tax=Pediococcus stilesii TaxID=331679 RepID=UPI0014866EEE|nr:hypothetical protein [Pediococcus stilesii]